jgi:uncharacterized membrane protein
MLLLFNLSCHNVDYRQTIQVYSDNLNFSKKKVKVVVDQRGRLLGGARRKT